MICNDKAEKQNKLSDLSFFLVFTNWAENFFRIFKPLQSSNIYICCILTFDPAKHAISKWCIGRKWHIPMASNWKKSRRWIWLTKWDKVKAHDTLIDWCTGREWPLNCMTVISAWWRSNMPFQRLSGRLNYYITRWRQEVRSWRSDRLVIRCGRESHTRPKGPSGPPIEFWRLVGEKMLGWEHVPERLGRQAPS